eukprot:764706-Hanusia_phi.AAC.13
MALCCPCLPRTKSLSLVPTLIPCTAAESRLRGSESLVAAESRIGSDWTSVLPRIQPRCP